MLKETLKDMLRGTTVPFDLLNVEPFRSHYNYFDSSQREVWLLDDLDEKQLADMYVTIKNHRKPVPQHRKLRDFLGLPSSWMYVKDGVLHVSRCAWLYPEATSEDSGERDEVRYAALDGYDGDITLPIAGHLDAEHLQKMIEWRT